MSSRGYAQPSAPVKPGVPVWTLVVCIIVIIILLVLAIFSFVQLQKQNAYIQNNIPPKFPRQQT
ncbi:MAG: hypothetical protein ACMG6E_01740 [Candidatus Roizmanbacteria bacterium]